MPEIILRKCKACDGAIEIDKNDIKDVISFKDVYYHKTCFCELANKRAKSKHGKPKDWQYGLDHLFELENDAKERLEYPSVKDDFNEYLITHYNVVAVPDRLWTVVGSLGKGIYKRKKCNPIKLKTLFEAWKWGQHKLDKINIQNRMNNRGPQTDNERILYDLAVLVHKVPNYLAHKAKMEAAQTALQTEAKIDRIDYSCMQRTEVKHEGLDDISALLDEF